MLLLLLWAAPEQPIPFSHKQHTELKLKCADCHAPPAPGEVETFPEAAKCMLCHQAVKTESPAIQDLKRFADAKRDVPWVRVYQIPSYVYFSHKVHAESGAGCETCHGPVGERERLERETDISMGGCMTCHRTHKAPLDCAACHELRG